MYKTKNLGLNITEIEKDKLQPFSFKIDLGDNFEAIDTKTLSHRNITNCLLEVQQDIKLELVDGVLTIKAGSKCYVPNGFESDGTTPKFDEIIIEQDISRNNFLTNGKAMVFIIYDAENSVVNLGQAPVENVESGNSDNNIGYYYRTNENKIYSAGVWNRCSLPIMVGTSNGTTLNSIDQVFNGFGYIGSTYFALPGVKCLIPNGRNKDGSLNNIEHVLNTVQSYTITDEFIDENAPIVIMPTHIGYFKSKTTFYYGEKPSNPSHHTRWFDVKNNYWWEYSDEKGWVINFYCVIGEININNTIINSFTYKNSFKAVDYNDYQSKITELETKIQALQAAVEALQG